MPLIQHFQCDVCGVKFSRSDGRHPSYGDGVIRCVECKEQLRFQRQSANAQEDRQHYPHNTHCDCTACFYKRTDEKFGWQNPF